MKKKSNHISSANNEFNEIVSALDYIKSLDKELSPTFDIFLSSMRVSVFDDILLKPEKRKNKPLLLKIKNFIFYSLKMIKNIKFIFLSNKIEKCDVVFYPVQPTHVEVSVPVINYLLDQGIKVKVVVDREKIYSLFNNHNISPIYLKKFFFSRFIDLDEKSEIISSLSKAAKRDYSDQNYKNKVLDVIKILNSKIDEFIFISATYRLIEKRFKPKVIVVGNDITQVGCVISLLASKNISTHMIMHGQVSGWHAHKYHTANMIHVFGKNSLEALNNYGVNLKNISLSGAPHLSNKIQGNEILSIVRKNGFSKYFLILLSGPGYTVSKDNHKKIINEIRKAAKELKNVMFIFKLHRKDSKFFYSNMPDNVFIYSSVSKRVPKSLSQMIYHSQLIITGGSGAALEAMQLGRSVITIDMMDELNEISFIRDGLTHHVSKSGELLLELNKYLVSDIHSYIKEINLLDIFKRTGGDAAEYIGNKIMRDL